MAFLTPHDIFDNDIAVHLTDYARNIEHWLSTGANNSLDQAMDIKKVLVSKGVVFHTGNYFSFDHKAYEIDYLQWHGLARIM